MTQTIRTWIRRKKRLLQQLAVLLLLAGLIGGGICIANRDTFLPNMNGKGYKIQVSDGNIYCTLGRESDNLLLCLSPTGELLSYHRSPQDTFVEEFQVYGNHIYAVVTQRNPSSAGITQSLMRFSTDRKTMKPELITPLDTSGKTRWKSVALEEPDTILLAGFSGGKVCTAEYAEGRFENRMGHVWAGVEDTDVDRIIRIQHDDLAWINMTEAKDSDEYGKLNLIHDRQIYLNAVSDQLKSPNRMASCDGELFVSDSIRKAVFRITDQKTAEQLPGKMPAVSGKDADDKMNLANFAVYGTKDDGFHMAGLWSDGENARIRGDEWTIDRITSGQHVPVLYWQNFWPAALTAFIILLLLGLGLKQMFCSRRLAVRLLSWEAVVALVLLAVMMVMQFRFYTDTVHEAPEQRLKLMTSSMVMGLTADEPMSKEQLDEKTETLWSALIQTIPAKEQRDYRVRVVWKTENDEYDIGYDEVFARGYLVQDLEDQTYRNNVAQVIRDRTENQILNHMERNQEVYHCMSYLSQGDRQGCVIVWQNLDVKARMLEHISWQLLLTLTLCPLIFLALLLATRRLLAPLNRIREALEQFHSTGGGNKIKLSSIPHTELYEIGRVFNQLSVDTLVQKNELASVNQVYARIVPQSMMKMLEVQSVSGLTAGKAVNKTGNILMITAQPLRDDEPMEPDIMSRIIEQVGEAGGFMVDSDEQWHVLTALFAARDQAIQCGHKLLKLNLPVLPTVLEETVSFGVFGGDHLLYPTAHTTCMNRRMAVVRRLCSFHVGMLHCGSGGEDLRLLGWDEDTEYYEEVSGYSPAWRSIWQEAAPIWQRAMELYRSGAMNLAARMFEKVLQLMPEDIVTQWYLTRSVSQREMPDSQRDCSSLCGGEELQ